MIADHILPPLSFEGSRVREVMSGNEIYMEHKSMTKPEILDKLENGNLAWWFVYGPGRSGTSYVSRMASQNASLLVSDWGLGAVLNSAHRMLRVDQSRFFRDLGANILENAPRGKGKGNQIDLVVKQARCTVMEYEKLCEMFGPAQRRIFCMREPAGYMSSAVKKFAHAKEISHVDAYTRMFEVYNQVGGDIIQYNEKLSLEIMRDFIAPFSLGDDVEEFTFKGSESPELVTPEMQEAYDTFRDAHFQNGAQFVRYDKVPEIKS